MLVTTPNDTHKAVILESLDAGKAVYTDKPIAHTMEDAGEIARAAAASGVPFAVGHSARRLGGHRAMKQWVETGKIGQVSLAEANFSNERGLELTTDTWRWFADKSPGGAMIQLGVHHADNLQYLLGPVAAVSSHRPQALHQGRGARRHHVDPRVRVGSPWIPGHGMGLARGLSAPSPGDRGEPVLRPRLQQLGRVPSGRREEHAGQPGLSGVRQASGRHTPHRHVPGATRRVRTRHQR